MSAVALASPSADTLRAASVTADRGVIVTRTDTASVRGAFTVTDLMLSLPSVQIGDNGGFSGLKTMSLRGMGSPHTAVYVDGVRVGNVQSGQSDLGLLPLDSFSSSVVDYARGSISFVTARPSFEDGKRASGHVRLRGGSFGTVLPSGRLDFKLSERFSLSANASAVISEGNYPYGDGLKRSGNDVRQMHAGADLFGTMRGGEWHAKAGMSVSDRGTPGSISWPSDDRQADENLFVQGLLAKSFSSLYSLKASAKLSRDRIDYLSSWGNSSYLQDEWQLNSSHAFHVNDALTVSLAADVQHDALESEAYTAVRTEGVAAVAAALRMGKFSLDAAVEYSLAFDEGASVNGDGRFDSLSPSIALGWDLPRGWSVSAFSRRAYRAPYFNELYYAGYGNPELKPEDAWLNDIGADWHRTFGSWSLRAKADLFCNLLSDKIISAPSSYDSAIWLPYNIGKVLSAGADVEVKAGWRSGDWAADGRLRYSRQSAMDRTAGSSSYGEQIPYVAAHSAGAEISVSWKGWSLRPVWTLRAGRRDSYGPMPDWSSIDMSMSKAFKAGPANVSLSLDARNLADVRYELSSGYPMPGRSILGGISITF